MKPSLKYPLKLILIKLIAFLAIFLPANYLTLSSFVYELQLQRLFVKVNVEGVDRKTMEQIYRKGLQRHDPDARTFVITFLNARNEEEFAYKLSLDSPESFPRNLRLLESVFQYNLIKGNYPEAIRIKKRMIELDPLNATFKTDLESITNRN